MPEMVPYDEFALIHENAEEFGITIDQPVNLSRVSAEVAPDRRLSALLWGGGKPSTVFLHGGGQNAHTWDTVALAMRTPLLAIDLPGHGHSDAPSAAGAVAPRANAVDVARAMRELATAPSVVVGMSLGGLTTIALTNEAPELLRAVVLIDITPGIDREKSAAIANFVNGPQTFPDFDAILQRTIEHNPTRTVASLRRGILHNALQLPDGSWVWRYRRFPGGGFGDSLLGSTEPTTGSKSGSTTGSTTTEPPAEAPIAEPSTGDDRAATFAMLWEYLSNVKVPLMFVRGMRPQSVVSDADEQELRRRLPRAHIVQMDAGHSVQGDRPVELADEITRFINSL
jgi:pimeloyl-ACP methyl ester carboxylesterase